MLCGKRQRSPPKDPARRKEYIGMNGWRFIKIYVA
jgi:hypothetical protein